MKPQKVEWLIAAGELDDWGLQGHQHEEERQKGSLIELGVADSVEP